MSDRVNGVIVIPHWADFSSLPESTRRYRTEIATALDGSESRSALMSDARDEIRWTVTASNREENQHLESRVLLALEDGNASAPWWGRAFVLASDTSGTSVSIQSSPWAPAVGDRVIFMGPPGRAGGPIWEVGVVDSISGGTSITLEDPLSNTYKSGSLCWPLITGKFQGVKSEAVNADVCEWQMAITGTSMASNVFPSADPDPDDIPDDRPLIEEVPLIEENLANDYVQLSATLSDGSAIDAGDSPAWEIAPSPGGPYTSLTTTSVPVGSTTANICFDAVAYPAHPSYWHILRPVLWDKWIRVTITSGGNKYTSAPLQVKANTVERLMRVAQERYEWAYDLQWTWPSRLSDGRSPGLYPNDGFYEVDLKTSEASNHVRLLTAIYDHLISTLTLDPLPAIDHRWASTSGGVGLNNHRFFSVSALSAGWPGTITVNANAPDAPDAVEIVPTVAYENAVTTPASGSRMTDHWTISGVLIDRFKRMRHVQLADSTSKIGEATVSPLFFGNVAGIDSMATSAQSDYASKSFSADSTRYVQLGTYIHQVNVNTLHLELANVRAYFTETCDTGTTVCYVRVAFNGNGSAAYSSYAPYGTDTTLHTVATLTAGQTYLSSTTTPFGGPASGTPATSIATYATNTQSSMVVAGWCVNLRSPDPEDQEWTHTVQPKVE